MALAEVVVDVEPGNDPCEVDAGLVHLCQLGDGFDQRHAALVTALKRGHRHRVAERPRRDGMALGVVGVEQRIR
jgi:hypothetical protein